MKLERLIPRSAPFLFNFRPSVQHSCFQCLPHSFILPSWKSFVFCLFPKTYLGCTPQVISHRAARSNGKAKSCVAIELPRRHSRPVSNWRWGAGACVIAFARLGGR